MNITPISIINFFQRTPPISHYKRIPKFYKNPNLVELPAVDRIPTYEPVPSDIAVTTVRGPPGVMENEMDCKYNCHKECVSLMPSLGCSRKCFRDCEKHIFSLPDVWSN